MKMSSFECAAAYGPKTRFLVSIDLSANMINDNVMSLLEDGFKSNCTDHGLRVLRSVFPCDTHSSVCYAGRSVSATAYNPRYMYQQQAQFYSRASFAATGQMTG